MEKVKEKVENRFDRAARIAREAVAAGGKSESFCFDSRLGLTGGAG